MPSLVLSSLYSLKRLWWRLRRPVTLGVRIAPISPAGEVLLVEHTYLPGWYLPGGGVDAGETLAEAGARELAEEVGLSALTPPELVRMDAVFKHGKSDHVALLVTTVAGEPRVARLEISQAAYFPLDAPPAGTSPLTLRQLAVVRARRQTP